MSQWLDFPLRSILYFSHRLGIPPFEKARSVLEGLSLSPPDAKPGKNSKKGSREEPDILHLCHTVPLEVVNMIGKGFYSVGKIMFHGPFWLLNILHG